MLELLQTTVNNTDLQILVIRFAINLIFMIILMAIYFRTNNNTKYLFNFIMFNILIFFVSSILCRISLDTGFAFGLFAIFSILRYRTEPVPIKEMTFMFTSIIMATINSTVTVNLSYWEILFANVMILTATYILEKKWLLTYKPSQKILFEKIELIHEDRREELIQELEHRTGYNIEKVKINEIDFLRDTARITIYME